MPANPIACIAALRVQLVRAHPIRSQMRFNEIVIGGPPMTRAGRQQQCLLKARRGSWFEEANSHPSAGTANLIGAHDGLIR